MHSIVSDQAIACDQPMYDGTEINYKLKRLGWSQKKLAQELKVAPSVINNVIHGRGTSFEIANNIAQILNTSVHELWPNRYVFKTRRSRSKIRQNLQEGQI